jgi:PAS domain S-box-containing protein
VKTNAQTLSALISHGHLPDAVFDQVIENLAIAVYMTDAEGRLTYFNPAAAKLSGRTPEIGTDRWCIAWKLFLADGRPLSHEECPMAVALKGGEVPEGTECVAERPDGTRFRFTPYPSVLRDREGRIIGGINFLVDITRRTNAELEANERGERSHLETHAAPLRHSDGSTMHLAVTHDIPGRKRVDGAAQLLSAIVDSSEDAIISKDMDGVITSWNQSAERLFGYTAAEAIGQTVASLIVPADRLEEEPRILGRLRQGERVDHFDTVRRRKDGSLLDISLTISPIKDAHGVIMGASKIARDITGEKRIQRELAESEARFRQLADSMPQIVWTARADGYIDYYNERWYQFTGFGRALFGAASWEHVLHPDDLEKTRQAWYAAINTGEPYEIEYRFWDRRENRWRWFMGRALPARDAAGTIMRWFGSSTDIDEQKHAEAELRRANEDLEQFAFSASHDLQEPLRSVKIYSELLAKRHSGKLDGEALKFMTFLRNGATRIETMVRDLLTYTQVTRSDEPAAVTDTNEALKTALANLSNAITTSGAEITSGALPRLPVNGTHLQQLFLNLIGNAIKYRSPERPLTIHLDARQHNGHWTFSVSDNGIGIDPDYKANIFGLFKSLHTNDEYSGTGIGLAICQRIVDRYHGRIWVESQPGYGSTFYFTLPA